ncbi:MAG: hypothetical protein COV72_02725 [Candidatus Omnitrophica bacterium CG11_big_fil_rev_8_21_14_0_20_42_13]|uniref:VOC domain-containing protein n=1 Tax=Candidatus Ghiorseimicrobium undicola TaxID=1974746 RepID=A0A2H0M1F1_9BACT|nr:MAG: hypothetical protein COV72_02725 [Candidatus Omnitrophica bacterium CG11_big_fil_rev_8_21_14_0_20_42_13]
MYRKIKTCAYAHIGIFSNKPLSLIRFYENIFGFSKEKQSLIPKNIIKKIFGIDCGCLMTVLSKGHIRLEIFSARSIKFKKQIKNFRGLNHWGYFVKDKARFVKYLLKSGVKIRKIKRGSHFVYFASDPEKNLIEIMEPPT